MKTRKFYLTAALVLLFAGNVFSQSGWGPGSNYNRQYDTNTIETLKGTVVSIGPLSPGKNMSMGVHLLLNTENGNISVHLGPSWYIDNQDIQISMDDNISVTGSKITYDGNQVIIAKEVTKGDQVLNLRDENGYPLWSGWRNR